MANRRQHEQRALDNEQFSRSLLSGTQYLDWAVAGLFYSALHLVEAYLDHAHGLHMHGHRKRQKFISSNSALKPVRREYRELRQRCDDARYDLFPVTAKLVADLTANEFAAVKAHITPLL